MTESSNRTQMNNYLENLICANKSTKQKSPAKLLREDLFQPILSSKKATITQDNAMNIDESTINVTSPISPLNIQDDSIFTTSSNNRYTKNTRVKPAFKSYSKKRSQTRKNALNNSTYDNSDLSDIDKELSVSAGKGPPEPAMVSRTPYQQANLNSLKIKLDNN